MSLIAFAFFNGLLLAAAAWDLRSFRIPNLLPLLLALGALLLAPLAGFDEALPRLASLGLVALVAVALYLLNGMGGGDVKLLVACAAWIPVGGLPLFATALGLAGATQGLATLAVARLAPAAEPHLARGGRRYMPYGVSIAAAGLFWSSLVTFAP